MYFMDRTVTVWLKNALKSQKNPTKIQTMDSTLFINSATVILAACLK